MPTEARHLPTYRAQEERLAWLTGICRELAARFPGKVTAKRNAGEQPPTCTVRLADGRAFAAFGIIDATWFWTFDGGESFHYAKDKDVMRQLLTVEFGRALAKDQNP